MYFKSENSKIGFNGYIVLVIGLIVYFLVGVGGYGFNLFPIGFNAVFVGIGVLISTTFLIYYLKNNNN